MINCSNMDADCLNDLQRAHHLRKHRGEWISRHVNTFNFNNTSASWVNKATLDIDCEHVRKIWDYETEYIFASWTP